MPRSRTSAIDDAVGSHRTRHAYLLTGGAGSGKTECALLFAESGLRRGERVLILGHTGPTELAARADRLRIDLKGAVRDGRLLLLRYRPDFARRVMHAASAEDATDDLRRQILEHRPQRLVIDTVAPLLEDGSASAMAATSIAELLALSQGTALLTYPTELSKSYDRRLEPLLQAMDAVLRLVSDEQSGRRVEVVSMRDPVCQLPESLGNMVAPQRATVAALDESLAGARATLLLLRVTESPSDDLLAALQLQHEVIVRASIDDPIDVTFDAVVIESDHAALEPARAVIRGFQGGVRGAPIVVATRFTLRSLDRARLLRDGADEVLAGDMGMPELLQRLAGALRRGHLARPPLAVHEDETLTQRALALPGELLDRDRFTEALRVRMAHDDAVPFTLLRLTTDSAEAADLRALGELVLTGMRANTGDLAALIDDALAIYLHGAGRRDIAPFLERLRARRVAEAPALRVTSACYPAESNAVRQLVAPLEVR
jgi:KaiC/GvpD/RAD55 family RecA-like ATPase